MYMYMGHIVFWKMDDVVLCTGALAIKHADFP